MYVVLFTEEHEEVILDVNAEVAVLLHNEQANAARKTLNYTVGSLEGENDG